MFGIINSFIHVLEKKKINELPEEFKKYFTDIDNFKSNEFVSKENICTAMINKLKDEVYIHIDINDTHLNNAKIGGLTGYNINLPNHIDQSYLKIVTDNDGNVLSSYNFLSYMYEKVKNVNAWKEFNQDLFYMMELDQINKNNTSSNITNKDDQSDNNITNTTKSIIKIIKENANSYLWNDIGILSTNTNNMINSLTNQTLIEVKENLNQKKITYNQNSLNEIINELNIELTKLNINLSKNMIYLFEKNTEDAITTISQSINKPKDTKEKEILNCMKNYKNNSTLSSFDINCNEQFSTCIKKIYDLCKIQSSNDIYSTIISLIEDKKNQMNSQFYNMYNQFYTNSLISTNNLLNSTLITSEEINNINQELTSGQIKKLIDYNYQEYAKNYNENSTKINETVRC